MTMQLPMTMQFEPNQLAAAELADRYIEIVLSTKPEQLIGPVSSPTGDVTAYAQRLTNFRQQLINQLSQQPLPSFEED